MQKKYSLTLLLFTALFFTSCIKKEVTPLGDEGSMFLKISGGGSPAGVIKNPINFLPTNQKIMVCDIRRDANSSANLNSSTTVVIKDDTAAVRAANAAYLQFPTAWYTIEADAPKVGGQGGSFTFTFKPGEFSKQIYINIPDATVMNPSALYGLGFTITSVSADSKISTLKSVVVEIGAKNAWDGVYSVESGLVTRYTAPGVPAGDVLSGSLAGNPDVYLITVGATTLAIPPPGTGGLQWAAGNNSYVAGVDGLRLVVDPSTNLTSMTSLGNATLTNWAGKINKYDPGTKTFYLAFRWNPTANVREYEVVLKYKRSR